MHQFQSNSQASSGPSPKLLCKPSSYGKWSDSQGNWRRKSPPVQAFRRPICAISGCRWPSLPHPGPYFSILARAMRATSKRHVHFVHAEVARSPTCLGYCLVDRRFSRRGARAPHSIGIGHAGSIVRPQDARSLPAGRKIGSASRFGTGSVHRRPSRHTIASGNRCTLLSVPASGCSRTKRARPRKHRHSRLALHVGAPSDHHSATSGSRKPVRWAGLRLYAFAPCSSANGTSESSSAGTTVRTIAPGV